MSLQTISFFGNGVQKRFTLPTTESFVMGVLADGEISAWSSVAPNYLDFETAPALNVKLTVTYMAADVPSTGGGITPEQLEELTSDSDLAGATSTILAGQNQLKTDLVQQLAFAGAYPGKIDLVNRASGLADPGFTKLGGVIVPESLFAYANTVLMPYTAGSSFSASAAASAYKVTIGSLVYLVESPGSYTNSRIRSVNLANMGLTTLPSLVIPANHYVSVAGSVNGKLFSGGLIPNSGNCLKTLYVFTAESTSWAQKADKITGTGLYGVADIGSGKVATFGGQLNNSAPSATYISNVCEIYNNITDTWESKTALPFRMSQVVSVVRPDNSVVLFPRYTSDGTTLVTSSRRVLLWSETGGSTELDSIPAEVANIPAKAYAQSDGRVVFVPTTVPSSGSRARILNPAAAPGSQWSNFDEPVETLNYSGLPAGEVRVSSNGLVVVSQSSVPFVSYVGTPLVQLSQSFYQMKNA